MMNTSTPQSENVFPFQPGQLVMLRAATAKLIKYRAFDPADIGIVLDVKLGRHKDKLLLSIYWQRTGKTVSMYDSRVKKV